VNPRYGLRAFSRDLKVSHSMLSLVMSNKRGISLRMSERICEGLGYNQSEKEFFQNLVTANDSTSETKRKTANENLEKLEPKFQEVEMSWVDTLNNWYSYAILELTYLEEFQPNLKWISQKLEISFSQAKCSVEKLFELGLIVEIEGRWVDNIRNFRTPTEISSRSIKDLHHQILDLAKSKLECMSPKERDFGALFFVIDEDLLDEAKAIMKKARRDLSKLSEKSKINNRVYCSETVLFPVDTNLKKIKELS